MKPLVIEKRLPPPLPAPTSRDWTEDAKDENGRHCCQCVFCKELFTGHKRRVICRVCAERGPTETTDKAREMLRATGAALVKLADNPLLNVPDALRAAQQALDLAQSEVTAAKV